MKSISTSKFLLATTSLLYSSLALSQYPDSIQINMPHTIRNLNQAIIDITFTKKDKQEFQFPKNFTIGSEDELLLDVIIDIQKFNGKTYKHYICNWSSIHSDALSSDPLELISVKNFKITDSLEYLDCLSKGKFRLRVLLNKRPVSGALEFPDYVAKSKWAYFYVPTNEIVLNRYWLKRMATNYK